MFVVRRCMAGVASEAPGRYCIYLVLIRSDIVLPVWHLDCKIVFAS